jgi:hypothetical protein
MASVASVVCSAPPGVTVVVSDNSTSQDEKDRLREFCARQPDGIVEYIEPPEPLAMSAHWEWLWHRIDESISPTHVSYLTDRMVFAADALAELADVVASNPSQVISYHWDHVNDVATPVALVQSPWTGQLLELDCARLVELSSRGSIGDYIPRLMTCIAPTTVLATLQQRFGDVFGPVSPDFRFAYRCLAVCETILYFDRPCLIEQGMGSSAGISYLRGSMNDAAAQFARELPGERFGATPEPRFETVANAIFHEYCSVREELGDDRFPPLDRRGYLTANSTSVDRIEEPRWRARMRKLLRERGWSRRDKARHVMGVAMGMAGYLLRHPGALVRTIKRQLWDRPPGTAAGAVLTRLGLNPRTREDLTFESAAAAIAHANAHPRAPTSHAWHVHQLARAGAIVSARPRPDAGPTHR